MLNHDLTNAVLKLLGGKLPENYMVVDLETTGFSPTINYACQYAMLQDGAASSFLLYRPHREIHPKAVEVNGLSESILKANGMAPELILPGVYARLNAWKAAGNYFIGHNMFFDENFLIEDGRQYGFTGYGDNVIDTGLIVKAIHAKKLPFDYENIRLFLSRVKDTFVKGKWNLWDYCYPTFKLDRYISKKGAHGAGHDCRATEILLHELLGDWKNVNSQRIHQQVQTQEGRTGADTGTGTTNPSGTPEPNTTNLHPIPSEVQG